jgi:predicted nucleic acid-binding protein
VNPESLLTSSAVADISVADGACASDGKLFEAMRDELNKIKPKRNNTQDTLIAETAIVNGLTLLTGDRNLREVA